MSEVTSADGRLWFVGLSHVQHSAVHFLLRYTGNVGFRYIYSLAKAAIFFYSVKTMKSTAEGE